MSAQHTLKNSNRKIEPVQERQLSLFTNSHFFGTILDLRSDKMQMIKSHFIVAITIFILKVSGAKAACYWNGDVCLIYCINMDAASIMEPIEDLYAERPACYDQLTLRLRTLSYPNNTIDSYWFTADIKAVELEVHFNEVQSLSADAFNADAFRTVKKLTFENFRVPLIVNETFNGLDALEIIDIKGAGSVSRIETGVLDSLTELQQFIFEQSLRNNPELNIDGFTGSGVLSKLEYVKIRYNLANSIKKSTFIGLRNVKRLDLSSCQIISIEDNSFDPVSETIEELNLSGNALTTVSYGVFSMALPNIKIINVNGNRWDCVCDLMAFRLFIEQYEENFIGHDCSSPTHCRISNIVESDCFDTCEIPSTTTSATTTTISETTIPIVSTENTFPTTIEPTTNESNDTTDLTTVETTTSSESNLIVECPDMSISDTISIERPIGYMTISENEDGEANLHIETEEDVNSLVVIRLDEMEKSGGNTDAINCLSQSDVSAIPITDVKNGVIYSYCLMRKTSTSVSPLDCIPYIKRQGAMVGEMVEVWLPDSSKTLAISLAVVSLILSCFLGMIIAFCLMKCCYFCKHNNHQPSRMVNEPREAFSHDCERITTDKPSNVHNRNPTQTLSISGQNDALKYRSFTETTPKLCEESSYPYYATVEEKPKL